MKKIVCILLSLAMVLATAINPMTSYASSEDNYLTVADYRGADKNVAPEAPEGTVFAGWYKDAACTQPWGETITEEKAYAKFVNEKVLSVKYQLLAGTTVGSEETTLRLVTTVDSAAFRQVGFVLTMNGENSNPAMSNTVYSRIKGIENGQEVFYDPDVFCQDSEYFMVYEVTEMPKDVFGEDITVTPQWETLDGTTVTGVPLTFSVVTTLVRPDVLSAQFNADGTVKETVTNRNFDKVGTPTVAYNAAIGKYEATFDGSSAYTIGLTEPFTNSFTIEAYGKFNGMVNDYVIFGQQQGGGYGLYISNGKFVFEVSNGSWQSVSCPADTDYHHFVVTWDGSTLKLYLDGELMASKAMSGTYKKSATAQLTLGADTSGSWGIEYTSKSTIATMNLYTNALTAEEVQAVHDACYKSEIQLPEVQLPEADVLSVQFNEDGTAKDTVTDVKFGKTGTPVVAYNETIGKYEATFNGADAFDIDFASGFDQIKNAFTIELYGKFNGAQNDTVILGSYQGGGIGLWYYNGGHYFEMKTSASNVIQTTGTGMEYEHIVITYDGSTLSFYVNGELLMSRAASGTVTPGSQKTLYLGADVSGNGLPEAFSKSTIVTANIYSDALSAEDIQAVYNANYAN